MQFTPYYPTDPKSIFYSKDFDQMIDETYTQKLKSLGFTFDGAISLNAQDTLIHILKYTHDSDTAYRPKWLEDICNFQEEGFASTYNLFFGTLIITLNATI